MDLYFKYIFIDLSTGLRPPAALGQSGPWMPFRDSAEINPCNMMIRHGGTIMTYSEFERQCPPRCAPEDLRYPGAEKDEAASADNTAASSTSRS